MPSNEDVPQAPGQVDMPGIADVIALLRRVVHPTVRAIAAGPRPSSGRVAPSEGAAAPAIPA